MRIGTSLTELKMWRVGLFVVGFAMVQPACGGFTTEVERHVTISQGV